MIEGSGPGAGSIPLTNGSERPKNIRSYGSRSATLSDTTPHYVLGGTYLCLGSNIGTYLVHTMPVHIKKKTMKGLNQAQIVAKFS
jgi:hypothetical protein